MTGGWFWLTVWVIGGVALGVVLGVGGHARWRNRGAGVAATAAHPIAPSRDEAHHRRITCAGCGDPVIRARCHDHQNRFFNERPVPVVAADPPRQEKTESAASYEARLRRYRRQIEDDEQLWVFDPSRHMAMVRYQPGQRVSTGLEVHYCALGRGHALHPPPTGTNVRWRTWMTHGDFLED